MTTKKTIADVLYKASSRGLVSFHDAIRLYDKASFILIRKRSPSGRFTARKIHEHMIHATASGASTAWTSVAFPAEILQAFGISAMTLEVMAGVFSTLGLVGKFLELSDQADVPLTMCSFHRALIGIAKSGVMKRPMAVCATSIMCDGNLKSFEVAAREQDVPFIFIDIPFEQGEAGAAYVKGQLETACLELERLTGVHDWRERLTPIAHKVNRAFAIQRECHSLRALSRKNLYHGHEIAGFTFPFHFMLGSDRLIEVLESRLKDLRHGREHNRWFKYPTFTEDCKRLMWLHIVPQYDTPIWKMIDDGVAARVVCDEYSSPYFEDYDATDPLGSIARRLISHPSNGPIQRRIDHVLKVAREFGVWGIIHYSSWGCHQAAGNVHMLGKVLQENGFRFININGDAVDQKNLSLEQHRTRLEAFLE